MDLVDEQHLAGHEVGEDRRHLSAVLDGRSRGEANLDAELLGHDRRQGCLSEARRTVEQKMIGSLATLTRGLQRGGERALRLDLTDVLRE